METFGERRLRNFFGVFGLPPMIPTVLDRMLRRCEIEARFVVDYILRRTKTGVSLIAISNFVHTVFLY